MGVVGGGWREGEGMQEGERTGESKLGALGEVMMSGWREGGREGGREEGREGENKEFPFIKGSMW